VPNEFQFDCPPEDESGESLLGIPSYRVRWAVSFSKRYRAYEKSTPRNRTLDGGLHRVMRRAKGGALAQPSVLQPAA